MIDLVFERLSSRNDNGNVQFTAMLESLCQWSHFDEYYFSETKKLNIETAQQHIRKLRTLKSGRELKSKEKVSESNNKREELQKAQKTLEELYKDFSELSTTTKIKPQERGFKLEKILIELARISNLEVSTPFKIKGEQIDGSIKYDGEHYLLEAKWEDKELSTLPLYVFSQKVQGKLQGRGLFLSINGFVPDALDALTKGKAINTILIDGEDLVHVLQDYVTFTQLIARKIKAAQTKGQIYINAISEKEKI